MLLLRDTNSVDLVATPPEARIVRAQLDAGADYSVQVYVIETAGTLPVNATQGVLTWNDGTPPELFAAALSSSGTLFVDSHRVLAPGNHSLRFEGVNFRAPVADQVSCNFDVTVLPRVQTVVPAQQLFGPILPKDNGFPNSQQWDFNTGYGQEILQSAVKMLLLTAKGERIMEPNYGTNLRRLLFEPNTTALDELARQEIADAMTIWEPRVTLTTLTVQKTSERSIDVYCTFTAKTLPSPFSVQLTFEA